MSTLNCDFRTIKGGCILRV